MKKLMLIRHASATHDSGFKDFERPLTEKGLREAEKMSMRLQHQHFKPTVLIASPALRTLATANVFSELLMMHPVETIKAIYDATNDGLLDIINKFSDQHDFIAVVGHNPAISQLIHTLSGTASEVPPCTVAIIEFAANKWADLAAQAGKIIYYSTPDHP